jgi:hypothetical protein
MSALQFLASLPAVLGLAGFVIFYFLRRNQRGDEITREIVMKLRRGAPNRLPAQAESLTPATLTRLVENDATLRSQISDQDFQLLRDALRQQFVTSLTVYGLCGFVFLVGVALYTYVSIRPKPVSVSSISVQSADHATGGALVDLYPLRVVWNSNGDPEDLSVLLEDLDNHHRTSAKTVGSTEGVIVFDPDEYRRILNDRSHGGSNRLRAVAQSANATFMSTEAQVSVGTVILAALIEPTRLKIIGMIDNFAIPNYNFEAQLLVWVSHPGSAAQPVTYGGDIKYGYNDFHLDPTAKYDWSTRKLVYLGPDNPHTIRPEYLGF